MIMVVSVFGAATNLFGAFLLQLISCNETCIV